TLKAFAALDDLGKRQAQLLVVFHDGNRNDHVQCLPGIGAFLASGAVRRTNVPCSGAGPSANSPPTSSIRLRMLRNPFLPLSSALAGTPRPLSSISRVKRSAS